MSYKFSQEELDLLADAREKAKQDELNNLMSITCFFAST